MSSDLTREILDGVYTDLGIEGVFEPKSGAEGHDCLILPDQGDGVYNLGGLDITAERTVFTVRRSEIPAIVRGDVITFPKTNGTSYKVNAKPRCLDPEKALWFLELVEVTS